jgi:hypothetical protein
LYTLNCESVVLVAATATAVAGGGDAGSGTAAAAVPVGVGVDGSVLEDVSSAFGAVDARFGGEDVATAGLLLLLVLLLGVDIRHLCGTVHTRARLT